MLPNVSLTVNSTASKNFKCPVSLFTDLSKSILLLAISKALNDDFLAPMNLLITGTCKLPTLNPWDLSVQKLLESVNGPVAECKNLDPEITVIVNGTIRTTGQYDR